MSKGQALRSDFSVRSYVGGRNPRAVVALYPDGKYDCFPSIAAAARMLGYVYMHIRRCCNMNEARNVLRSMSSKTREIINTDYRYRGIRFYFCPERYDGEK